MNRGRYSHGHDKFPAFTLPFLQYLIHKGPTHAHHVVEIFSDWEQIMANVHIIWSTQIYII